MTSVPAKSLGIDFRVGYVRPGYDADIVVWDSHPLLAGATPIQVYIDGKSTLDPIKVAENTAVDPNKDRIFKKPKQRISYTELFKETTCKSLNSSAQNIIVTGIKESYLMPYQEISSVSSNLTMVINNGQIVCLNSRCETYITENAAVIELQQGTVLPGLTAYSPSLGLAEILAAAETSDGSLGRSLTLLEPENIIYAKHGIHLDGRGFSRARIGGVTLAVTSPISDSFFGGISTAIKTSGKHNILNGGIFQEDIALHFSVGQMAKRKFVFEPTIQRHTKTFIEFESVPTASSAISKLQHILLDNIGKNNIYGTVANGTFPLVVNVDNEVSLSPFKWHVVKLM